MFYAWMHLKNIAASTRKTHISRLEDVGIVEDIGRERVLAGKRGGWRWKWRNRLQN